MFLRFSRLTNLLQESGSKEVEGDDEEEELHVEQDEDEDEELEQDEEDSFLVDGSFLLGVSLFFLRT